MSLQAKTILAEQYENLSSEFAKKFKKYDENWHNGETFVFENETDEVNDMKYFQFQTYIEEEQIYFVFDEIITIDDKPVLLLQIHNEEKQEMWQQLIYLEKDKVVQQIRHLSYQQFFQELENKSNFIKLKEDVKEDDNTTTIRTPFLDFINNLNKEQEENIKNKKLNKIWWKVLKIVIFLVGCVGSGILSFFAFTPLVTLFIPTAFASVIAASISAVIISGVTLIWQKNKEKIKKWFLPKSKNTKDLKLEEKFLEQQLKFQKELFSTTKAKREKMLSVFEQIWNKNKNKTFMTIQNELSQKFEKNKEDLKQQNLEEMLKNVKNSDSLESIKNLSARKLKSIQTHL